MSMLQLSSPMVSVTGLESMLDAKNLIILDASVPPIAPFTSVVLPQDSPDRYIPGSRYFDYDHKVCDQNTHLPHMLPDADTFSREVQKLGVNQDSAVVIYDDVGVYASPRARWMFKAMGHDNVAVLNGGAPAWHSAGLPMVSQRLEVTPETGNFRGRLREHYFCDAIEVYQLLNDKQCVILDARSAGRFYGVDPEPRANLRGGHMPNARNLPFQQVLDDIYMKPPEELAVTFAPFAADAEKLVFTCGSGLSACILQLASELAGYKNLVVYDGSWCEWGLPSKLPVVTTD